MRLESSLTKTSLFFLVAALTCVLSASAQDPQIDSPKAKLGPALPAPNLSKLTFDNVVTVGGIYLRRASDELPQFRDNWFLEIGGDPVTLAELVPAVVRDYSTQHIEVRILDSKDPKSGEIRVVLKGGTARKELQKEDFTEDELSGLRQMRNAGDSADKWLRKQVTRPALLLWVRKYTGGLLPDEVGIPNITDSDFEKSALTAKLSAWVFYRTQANLEVDPTLNKQGKTEAWEAQQKELILMAERSIRLHGLITVRKVATDANVAGKIMYQRFADGSWKGKPIVVLFWGGANAMKWAPFVSTRADVSYAEDIERQILLSTGLDKLLSQQEQPKANAK